MIEAQERLNEIWQVAAEKAARARGDAFREAALEARDESARAWIAEHEEYASAMRAARSLLFREAEKAWPSIGRPRVALETAPDLLVAAAVAQLAEL